MMKILITGGAGFIGSHIADKLIEEGHKVVVIDNLSTGKKGNMNEKVVFYKEDILSLDLEKIFKKEKPEVVFHFAAHTEARVSAADPMYDAKVNILGSINVLENCRKYKVKKIIFSSSGGEVYGDAKEIPTTENYAPSPLSPYGIAKLAVEKYLQSYSSLYGLEYVSLRLGNVYGPRQNPNGEAGVVAIFTQKMLKREQPLIHGDGTQSKDYIFIDDVVKAAMLSLKRNINGIFNIGTGKESSVLEIFEKLKNITESSVRKKHIVFPLIGFKRGCLSTTKAKKDLGFLAEIPLNKGLEITVDWFKK